MDDALEVEEIELLPREPDLTTSQVLAGGRTATTSLASPSAHPAVARTREILMAAPAVRPLHAAVRAGSLRRIFALLRDARE